MSARQSIGPAEALFAEALRSPGNMELLEKVREHADEMLAALEASDHFGPSDEELSQIDPTWLAAVYNALSPVQEPLEVEGEFYASAAREESVGVALREALMAGIPEHLQRFEAGLASLDSIEEEEQQELLNTPSAQGAGSFARPLARVGLTPLSVFYASDGVSYLIERLVDQELLPEVASIMLGESEVTVDGGRHNVLTWELVVDEVRRLSVCNAETAREVYRWLINVAQYKPYVFSGFECEPAVWGRAVYLRNSQMRFDNLYQRWGLKQGMTNLEGAVGA